MTSCRFRWLYALALRPRAALLVGVFLLAITNDGVAGTAIIGRVTITEGEVFIITGGVSTRAEPGSTVKAADTLITGSGGSMGIILADDTRISLGPTSAMLMKKVEFDPLHDKNLFVARLNKGSMLYESHWDGKVASVETPHATIGIRGTRFLIRVEDE